MVITGRTVLKNMRFELEGASYYVDADDRAEFLKVVAKDSLRVTSEKRYRRKKFTHSVTIKKSSITGEDVANALVECEKNLRAQTTKDQDHCFFEGWCTIGDAEVVCNRWGS